MSLPATDTFTGPVIDVDLLGTRRKAGRWLVNTLIKHQADYQAVTDLSRFEPRQQSTMAEVVKLLTHAYTDFLVHGHIPPTDLIKLIISKVDATAVAKG